jgi:hypothetical protein
MPPGPLHEALRNLFAKTPELVQQFVLDHLELPYSSLSPVDSELSQSRVTELRPDAVLACPGEREPQAVVIVEVQLAADPRKRARWPQYVAAAYQRYGCPTELLVVTPSPRVERWASAAIVLGRSSAIVPVVLGPSALPLLKPDEIERRPVLALLSTLAHMTEPRRTDETAHHALWTFETLASWPGDAQGRLADILESSLSAAVRGRMEELMRTEKYEYKSEFAKKYYAEGLEQGLERGQHQATVSMLLKLLERDFGPVCESDRQRIEQATLEQLQAYVDRALSAERIEDVLG